MKKRPLHWGANQGRGVGGKGPWQPPLAMQNSSPALATDACNGHVLDTTVDGVPSATIGAPRFTLILVSNSFLARAGAS